MSPRRSSRARTTQPTPLGPQPSNSSSSSSITSGRASRSAGSDHKPHSQRSSIAARSQSSEDRDTLARAQARRTRSSQENVNIGSTNAIEDDLEDEGEEEVTRCICGNQEYPGLPETAGDFGKGSSKGDPDPTAFAEDTTGWFIQCDGCKVWQHGGCVGIMVEATSPEEYFCEQCHKDLHRVTTTANGRKYSVYLPAQVSKSAHSSPVPASKKHLKRSKDSSKSARQNAESVSKGRRSTMNSRENRDAALEEKQLRIAIEESKRDGGTVSTATGVRKGKRSRSPSEERSEDTKRQRTTSGSASSASQSKSRRQNSNSEGDVEKPEQVKNIRGAAAQNHRNKEVREARREKERVDAGKTKGRVPRDDESGSATPDPPSRTVSARTNKPPTTSFPAPALPDPPPPKSSHKKTGRPPARRGRVGRNQYTKDRDLPNQVDAHHKSSPVPSNSSQNGDGGTPHANGYGEANGLGKPSKPRHMNPNKTTMNDMKRRVANILEFISITQIQMAGTTTASIMKSNTSTSTSSPPDSHSNGNSNASNGKRKDEVSEKTVSAALSDLNGIDEQAFAALSSLEMMDVLTRQLVRWQGEYGKWDK